MLVAGWGSRGPVLVVRGLGNIFFTQKPRITDSWGGRMGKVFSWHHQFMIWSPFGPQAPDPR